MKISIVVPIYNTPNHKLKRCFDSIDQIQDIQYECLLIDDGSDIDTQIFCKKYASEHPNFFYYRKINGGVSTARNMGIELAAGEYLFFVDSDDLLLADAFSNLEMNADLIVFDYYFIKGRKRYEQKLLSCPYGNVTQRDAIENALDGLPGFSWGILYRLAYLREHGFVFDTDLVQCEDMKFNFSIMTSAPKVLYANRKAYQYNYSVSTSLMRWKRNPEAMMYSGRLRFQQKLDYVADNLPDNFPKYSNKLIINRIHDIKGNAVDLCCVGHATKENKNKVEKMMANISLPANADRETRLYYNLVTGKKWWIIWLYAKMRMLYLRLMGI